MHKDTGTRKWNVRSLPWLVHESTSASDVSETSTCVKQISPVQFLRVQELGIHQTSNHFMKQEIEIDRRRYIFGGLWSYTAKRRVDRWELNKICDASQYKEAEYRSKRKYIEEFIEKIFSCRALYIAFPAGIGRRVELIVMDNLRFSGFFREDSTDYTASFDSYDEEQELQENYKGVWLKYRELKGRHYDVQDQERYCKSCERVTCKCSVEECDVI